MMADIDGRVNINKIPKRCLKIQISDTMSMSYKEIKFCCSIANQAMIEIVSLQDKSFCFILDCIIDQLTSMKKPIMIVIDVNEKVSGEMISMVFK